MDCETETAETDRESIWGLAATDPTSEEQNVPREGVFHCHPGPRDDPTRTRQHTLREGCESDELPDLTITIEDLIAEGDKVVVRALYAGTHEGEFFGIDPTGARGEMSAISIYKLDDRQITEEWH